MTNAELSKKIAEISPEAVIEEKQYLTVTVQPEKFLPLMQTLKSDPSLAFDYMFNITGVDYGKELGASYFLESVQYRHRVLVKQKTSDRQNAELDSVYSLWKTAEFHEREIYDLLGIKFKNHPDMRRIFLEDDWNGHPLRKDYVDEVNMILR